MRILEHYCPLLGTKMFLYTQLTVMFGRSSSIQYFKVSLYAVVSNEYFMKFF